MKENKPNNNKRGIKERWLSKLWGRAVGRNSGRQQQKQQRTQQHHHEQEPIPAITDSTHKADIPQEDIKSVCQRLADDDLTLVTLDLREHSLGTEEAAMLSSALRINDTLLMLNMDGNKLGDDGVLEIMRGLQNHVSIEYLMLSRNNVVDAGQLAPFLLHLPSLLWLDLSDNGIHEVGLLLEAVGQHKKLELLELSLNQISNGDAIGQALQQSTTLSNLNLFANHLDSDGAIAIAKSGLTSLTKLNLGYNRIGNIGGKALTEALNKSPTLTDLNMAGNPISDEEARAMMRSAATAA